MKYNYVFNYYLLYFCLYICFFFGFVDDIENFLGIGYYGIFFKIKV